MADAAQHLIRTHHLRDRFRRHEGTYLDRMQPRANQRLDEGNAIGNADRSLFILQAVARPDFDDADRVAHQTAAGSTSASSTPSPTISPTLHLIFFSTPA